MMPFVDPSVAVGKAYASWKSGKYEATVTTVSPLPRTAPTVVGRDAEIRRIEELLGDGGVLAIVGEAGMGKTRLARHATELSESAGWRALAGRAGTLDGDLPLAPVRDALRSHLRLASAAPPPLDVLATAFPGMVLPELRSGAASDEVGRDVVFEAAARWLVEMAGQRGLLLVLEDLHWADATTHQLILHLARVTAGARVAMVLTFRPYETERGSSLDGLRHDLARDRLADETELGPLDPAAVGSLLGGIIGVSLEPSLVALFASRGGGNPFVTEELLRMAVEGRHLAPRDGVWRGERALELPWSVAEMVLSRVRCMDDADQRLLRWAAVAGERFDPELLRIAAEIDEATLVAGLTRAREAGLLRDDDAGGMMFRHALTHEVVLSSLVQPERRRHHARLLAGGEELAEAGSEIPLGVLLGHAVGAGDRGRAFHYARLAVAQSLELGGEAEALTHCERALEFWSDVEGDEARADLLLQKGRLLHWVTQDHAGAVAALTDASHTFAALGLRDRAALATALREGARWWSGEHDALERLRAAPRELSWEAPLELRLEVLNEVARPLMLDGQPREAAALAEVGLALVPAAPTRRVRQGQVNLLTTLGTCRFVLGDLDGGEETLAESARIAVEDTDPVSACRAFHNVAFAVEDLSDMATYARAGLAVARQYGLRPSERSFLIALAARDAAAGHFDMAEQLCVQAEAVVGPWEGLAHIRLDVGLARAFLMLARGDVDVAREGFSGVLRRLRGARESGTWTAQRGLALACLGAGDAPAARAALAHALAGSEPTGYDRVLALAVAAEIAAFEGDGGEAGKIADELARVAPKHPGARTARVLAAALGGAPDTIAQVDEVADRHERAGRRVAAARWRLVVAETLADRGDPAAADLANQAREAFAVMGADAWCRRAELVMRRLGKRPHSRTSGAGAGMLTARELEVLRLVAEGFSNRAIANRLVISQGTAVRHVANIYVKLGVHSRIEAARAAADLGIVATADEDRAPT